MKVLVVDDSAYQRLTLASAIRNAPAVTAVDSAKSGEEAIRKLLREPFDLLPLDLEMPGMDGLAVLRWVMENRPMPVLIVTSLSHDKAAMSALELGAYGVLQKPPPSGPRRSGWQPLLDRSLEEAGHLRVGALTTRAQRRRVLVAGTADLPAAGSPLPGALAVAASTGGPPALRELFASFPRRALVVVVAQHMPAPFTRTLAAGLASSTGWEAREAVDGEEAEPGAILVAPAAHHLELAQKEGRVVARVSRAAPSDRWVPSADRLLSSVASVYGAAAAAVVLTGMGNDGAEGSRRIDGVGGLVIAESPESAVVAGMPDAAGHAAPRALRLPLPAIAMELERRFSLATLPRFHE